VTSESFVEQGQRRDVVRLDGRGKGKMFRDKIAGSMMAAALVFSTGCLQGEPEPMGPQIEDIQMNDQDVASQYQPVRGAVNGHLAGDIGPLSGLDASANLLSAYDDGYYLSVETVIEIPERAVMTLLSVSNGAQVFRPGLNATFTLENSLEDEVQVTLLGCVGQDVGVYDEYDAPADEVTVGVQEGVEEGEMDVAVQGRWYDRDAATGARLDSFRTASSSFTLLR
jgi:hypothetical protein